MNSGADIDAAWAFCDRILVDVSRSFALIIPKCPSPIDRSLCAGYLLCRLADTVEDDATLTALQRDRLYEALLACVTLPPDPSRPLAFVNLWPALPPGGYGELIAGTQTVLDAFASLPPEYCGPVAQCVRDMVTGMRGMRPVASVNGLAFYCRDLAELDRYCHHVAGTVGIMSTTLFERYMQQHRHTGASFIPDDAWRERGRRMGLGLQMTNIIKDAAVDAVRGVSFIPPQYVEWRSDAQNPPNADVSNLRLTRAGRTELIHRTLDHLDEAITYTIAVPAPQVGIRTFLLGSILPAVATLEIAGWKHNVVPRIERSAMQLLMAFIDEKAGDDEAIRLRYQQMRRRCGEVLKPA